MSNNLISKRSIGVLLEYFSNYGSLNTIRITFALADIWHDDDYVSEYGTMRRSLVDEYLVTLDLSDARDAQKLLGVFAEALTYIEALIERCEESDSPAPAAKQDLKLMVNALKADGFEWRDGQLLPITSAMGLATLGKIVQEFDAEYIAHQVKRLEACITTDPEAAIGGAKELIESTCKTILTDLAVPNVDDMEVPKLIKETQRALKLTPEDVPETARGKDSMKRLLAGLSQIAVSLAELRNEYGTGHGKHGKTIRPKVRHARLAVGCAASLATFLFETHQMKLHTQKNAVAP